MAIKAKELAKLLGVSTATVSLVLNDKPGICEDTRQQLIAKIREMGYDYMLKGGGDSRRGSIAFVTYPPEEPQEETYTQDPKVMLGAEAAAREQDYDLTVVCARRDPACRLSECLKRSAGFVVQKSALSGEDLEELNSVGVPFVVVDTCQVELCLDSVSVDNEQGVYKLVEYLTGLGHRDIGYIACGAGRASFREREAWWRRTLQRFALEWRPQWRLELKCPENDLTEALKALRAPGERLPTAFLCDDDMVAWRAVKAFRQAGLQVPGDVSVVGFDDRELCELAEPKLTTARIPAERLGREAVELLVRKLQRRSQRQEDCRTRISLGVELVLRDSVRDLGECL